MSDGISEEIEADRPHQPVNILTRRQKDIQIERAFHSLYRWYLARSQASRNWNPDTTFAWRKLRNDHSRNLMLIIQGYYAVEQYAPDYTAELTRLTRRSYGRSHFQMRWGSEEAKHADLWRNTLLFSGHCRTDWLDAYTEELRAKQWALPWDSPLHMLLYTVIQERATELNYLNTASVARGELGTAAFAHDKDPVLANVAATIAIDEAAHYNFFLEAARLYLYYYPEETLSALVEVLKHFTMPASDIVVDYERFISVLYDSQIFGRVIYARDIVRTALSSLGVNSIKRIEGGIAMSRQAPDRAGRMLPSPDVAGFEFSIVENAVERLFARIGRYEAEIGFPEDECVAFLRHNWMNS